MYRLETWNQGSTFWEYDRDGTISIDDLDDPILLQYVKENVHDGSYVTIKFKFWDVDK